MILSSKLHLKWSRLYATIQNFRVLFYALELHASKQKWNTTLALKITNSNEMKVIIYTGIFVIVSVPWLEYIVQLVVHDGSRNVIPLIYGSPS